MDEDLTATLDLVRSAQGGDAGALDRLIRRYYERVRRAVRARMGAQLRARLETADILQPAFAQAFRNFDRFEMRHEASLLHWLAEYAHRQMLDAVDRENAQKRRHAPSVHLDAVAADGESATDFAVSDAGTAPPERAAEGEQEAAIEACLDQLPEHYRRVIVLRDYDGLDWYEVAAALGRNTDSAARHLHSRALLELAGLLRRRGIGPD